MNNANCSVNKPHLGYKATTIINRQWTVQVVSKMQPPVAPPPPQQYQPTSPPPQQPPPPIPTQTTVLQSSNEHQLTMPNVDPGYYNTGGMVNPSFHQPQQQYQQPQQYSSYTPNHPQPLPPSQQAWQPQPNMATNPYMYQQQQQQHQYSTSSYPPMQQSYQQQYQGSYQPNPMAYPQQHQQYSSGNNNGFQYGIQQQQQQQHVPQQLSSSGMMNWNQNGMNHPSSGVMYNDSNQNAVGRYSTAPSSAPYSNTNYNVNNNINHPSGASATTTGASIVGRGNIPTAASTNVIRRPPFVDPDTNIVYDVNDPDYEGWLFKQSQWLKVLNFLLFLLLHFSRETYID
jgi:hypothetical protein